MRAAADRLPPSCKEPGRSCLHPRAHASNLFIPTTRLWAALKSRLLLGQAGFGSRNLPEISPKHRITDPYAWTLACIRPGQPLGAVGRRQVLRAGAPAAL